jgi:hypothetical protein
MHMLTQQNSAAGMLCGGLPAVMPMVLARSIQHQHQPAFVVVTLNSL